MNTLSTVLAFIAVLSGILVITAKNPVISVLFLISVFINVGGYLVLMGVAYIGLVYIIVYVGAIAILFLFVIMMLNLRLVELLDTGKSYTQNLPIASILGIAFFVELFTVLPGINHSNTNDLSFISTLYNKINTLILGAEPIESTVTTVGHVNDALALTIVAPTTTAGDITFNSYLNIEAIGQGLYTYSTLWLIIASFILLLSMMGPIVLCISNNVSANGS